MEIKQLLSVYDEKTIVDGIRINKGLRRFGFTWEDADEYLKNPDRRDERREKEIILKKGKIKEEDSFVDQEIKKVDQEIKKEVDKKMEHIRKWKQTNKICPNPNHPGGILKVFYVNTNPNNQVPGHPEYKSKWECCKSCSNIPCGQPPEYSIKTPEEEIELLNKELYG